MAYLPASSCIPCPVIDLRGPAGNAFALIRFAKDLARRTGRDEEEIAARMKAGSYTELVVTFHDEFGEFVDLIVPDDLEAALRELASA